MYEITVKHDGSGAKFGSAVFVAYNGTRVHTIRRALETAEERMEAVHDALNYIVGQMSEREFEVSFNL